MKKFNRDNRHDGGKRFGGDREFNRGDRGGRDFNRPSMHKAICDECGNDCEVPFRPTGDKPIYCSNCFQGKRDGGSSKFGKKDFRKSSFDNKKRYTAVCSKCGKSCEVPFSPTEGKPVYCDECFGKGGAAVHKETGCSKERFDALNVKLDKILKLLSSTSPAEIASKKIEEAKEIKDVKLENIKKIAEKDTGKEKVASEKPATKKVDVKKVATKKITTKTPSKKSVAKSINKKEK